MSDKTYTLEEVAQHNGEIEERIWIIYKHVVYDVTDYLSEHPGGGELIMEFAGKDITADFDDSGHSSHAVKLLKPLRIGEVAEEDRIDTRKIKSSRAEIIKTKIEKTKRRNRLMAFSMFRSCASG